MGHKKSNYSGVLGEAFIVPALHDLPFRELPDAESAEAARHDMIRMGILERLAALYKHYGINPTPGDGGVTMLELVLNMASRHVPGFEIRSDKAKGRGRPSKWHGEKGMMLFADIKALKVKEGLTILAACKRLSTQPTYKNMSPETIHSRYREVLKLKGSMATVMQILEVAIPNMIQNVRK